MIAHWPKSKAQNNTFRKCWFDVIEELTKSRRSREPMLSSQPNWFCSSSSAFSSSRSLTTSRLPLEAAVCKGVSPRLPERLCVIPPNFKMASFQMHCHALSKFCLQRYVFASLCKLNSILEWKTSTKAQLEASFPKHSVNPTWVGLRVQLLRSTEQQMPHSSDVAELSCGRNVVFASALLRPSSSACKETC